MEIAGASVCRGAELATRGMDSADVEPELPSAVQDLIRCLEGKADPSMQLRNLHRAEFQDFFPKTLRELTEWRRRVRKRVLEAIRSCKTFKYIDMKDIFRGDISRLEAEEWVFILEGFRSSTALRVIRVEGLTWTSIAEVEGFCLQVGKILKTSSVTHLTVGSCRLSATCFRNLATGLHGNSRSMLKSIELHNAWEDSSALEHVADIIKNATRLETLEIGGSADRMYDMDGEAARILSQALIPSPSLKTLVLKEAKGVLSAFLLKALSGDDVNRSIECLHLISVSGLGDGLVKLLSSKSFLKKVTLTQIHMDSLDRWRQLGRAIRENAKATISICSGDDKLEGVEELACAASPDAASPHGKDPTVELTITFTDDYKMSALKFVDRVLRGEIKSIKSLILFIKLEKSEEVVHTEGQTSETSVLESLKLFAVSKDVFKVVWKYLLRRLRGNTSLTRLDLSKSELDDRAFSDLMGLLQGNSALKEIDVSGTSWSRDGKAAQIQRALQNQKREVYMSVFQEPKLNLTFEDAKAHRLFLCGSPRAGKTQLRKTLMRINQGKSCLGKSCLFNERDELSSTKGIEVELVQNDDKMQISVWDLGGECIFRTLQNVLLPQTNYFCAFVFVYSPFCEDSPSNKDDSVRFKTELEEWLIFITSNSRVIGDDLPQVFIVISHKKKSTDQSLSWTKFEPIVEELRKTFENFVSLHPIGEDFHVDTRENNQVHSLYINICQKLTGKFPQVPTLCSQLNSLLVTNTKKNKSFPLWTSEKFYDFCVPTLKKFIPSLSAHFDDHSKIILKSIISYLNDVGSIIYIPKLDYIIVDPNWLTNTFLSELIALGQESESSKDGFVSEYIFAGLIEKFLAKQPRFQNVDRKVLENILINLDLCFKLKNSSQYFIPSFIPEHASKEQQNDQGWADTMNWDIRSETSHFVGIRIQCQDETTMSLTVAFFPRFQMFMRLKLISKMGVSEEHVTCSRHYLRFFLEKYQIYIEHFQGEKLQDYVDVLMLCPSEKSREESITYLSKHIVQELISFCASPKGCPGVVLVFGLIQNFCVEMLIPIHVRVTILIEKLKLDFKNSINEKLEEMPLERLHLVEKEKLFDYEHCWRPIERYTSMRFERARDLLWESDVDAVVNEIRQNRIQQLESLQEALISVDNHLAQCYPEAENMVSGSNVPQMKDRTPLASRCLSQSSTSMENHSTRLVLFEIEQLKGEVHGFHRKVDDLDERLREVHSIAERVDMKIDHILSVQKELQSTLSVCVSKVDRIIGYSQAFQDGKMPKRPYVTDDEGLFYSLSAGLHVGRIVRLHLMCESVTGFHTVKDQEGLKILLDSEKWKMIQKIIEISYKVIYYGAKAALTNFFGLGEAIPTWANVESDIANLDGYSSEDPMAVLTGGESKELQEAWLSIQQTLAPELIDRYSKIFKLYQVKYLSLEKGGHAWVCEKCLLKGLRCGRI